MFDIFDHFRCIRWLEMFSRNYSTLIYMGHGFLDHSLINLSFFLRILHDMIIAHRTLGIVNQAEETFPLLGNLELIVYILLLSSSSFCFFFFSS